MDDIGGLWPYAIMGGGDEYWIWAVFGKPAYFEPLPYRMEANLWEYITRVQKTHPQISYIINPSFHLWHGDKKHRQYRSRNQILRDYDYDPNQVTTNEILEWAYHSPLVDAVETFFNNRHEDGLEDT